MVVKVIKKIISLSYGKRRLQIFFELLNLFSLCGMNMGGGSDPKNSGEKNVINYINKHFDLTDKLTIFDVGANIGCYSLLLDEIFDKKAMIYSFEPSEKTFNKLASNVVGKGRICLHNFGFGDMNANQTLYRNADESGLSSIYKRRLDHFNLSMDKSENIEVKTIDAFCKEQKIEHIHFLKLDVEGHELKVLEGASGMLKLGAIDFIQFEFGGCNIDSRTFFQDFYYLFKDNYKIYRILKDGLYKINHYKERYEVFTTTNYLMERR